MSQYQQRDNSGSSFKNDKKREGKQDAEYEGSALIGGVEYWISTWIKNDPRKGGYDPSKKTFLSHSFREKQSRGQAPAREQKQSRPTPPPPAQQPPDDGHHDTDRKW